MVSHPFMGRKSLLSRHPPHPLFKGNSGNSRNISPPQSYHLFFETGNKGVGPFHITARGDNRNERNVFLSILLLRVIHLLREKKDRYILTTISLLSERQEIHCLWKAGRILGNPDLFSETGTGNKVSRWPMVVIAIWRLLLHCLKYRATNNQPDFWPNLITSFEKR